MADEVVLVVEDENAVRYIMARTLRECGYTVLEAAHGLQALEILERHGLSVRLIIADVVMPQISGRELAEPVLERWPDVPILFTSGYTGLFVVQRSLLDEGQEFIQKPIAPDILAQGFVRCWIRARDRKRSMRHRHSQLLIRESGAARRLAASYTYLRLCLIGVEDLRIWLRMLRTGLSLVVPLSAALLLNACLDSGQSAPSRPEGPAVAGPDGSMLEPIDLIYVCGNKFLATNSTSSQLQMEYRVAGTRETGSLTLREGTEGDPGFSETELETTNAGVVELYHDGIRITRRPNQSLPCGSSGMSASVVVLGPETTMGRWSAPFSWPIIGLHLTLLPNGKVLSWGKFRQPQVWTPSTGTFAAVPAPDWIFCSGHTLLSDGKVLVNGGHISDHHGIPDANLFDPGTMTWSSKPAMAKGRWYPTTTALANGEAVTVAGRDQGGLPVTVPEVWTGSVWRKLTSATRSLPYYPRTFLAPNGKIFYAGENRGSLYLTTSGTGSWTTSASRLYGTRDYGSAVMYRPGKILYVGGGRTTNTAEIIDLNQASPVWKWTNPMVYRRRHLNATILPTGQVLVTGGTSGTGFSDEAAAVYASELWDPGSGSWRTLASNSVRRVYHSTALLLPDGRVLLTGSGDATNNADHYNAELFSPPYLFNGARPTISSSPTTLGYGQSFFLGTPTPSAITRVTLVRLGSVTHAFDSNQRFSELPFVRTTGGLTVTTPASRNVAPPGHYMIFILNGAGVPSTARIIRIR